MNTPLPSPRLHPAILAAALSVSALALVGIGVLTGVIPHTFGTDAPPTAQSAPAPVPAATPAVPVAAALPPPAPVNRPAAKPVKSHIGKPAQVAQNRPVDTGPAAPPAPPIGNYGAVPPPPPVCKDCGAIESVREVAQEGAASGLGAVAGGVVGGLLGNQVGAGRGRSAATVLGAVGGAFAGNSIEKSQHKTVHYEIVVRFDDGTTQVLRQNTPPAWRQGDRVRLVNGVLNAGG